MANTVTSTAEAYPYINRVTIVWVSDGSGNATQTFYASGVIGRVAFSPGTSGSQPTDAYDITITDAQGIDILAGQGANLSNSAASDVSPGVPLNDGTTTSTVPPMVSGTLTLNVSNTGSAKSGTVVVYTR